MKMNRREFLKSMAGLSATWIAVPLAPILPMSKRFSTHSALLHSQSLNRLFQGTPDGLLLESRDGGATWQTIAKFGSHCSIQALFEQQGKVYAQIGVQEHSFVIASADARVWRTVDQLPIV